ncbi:MAG: hypothetical protein WCO99_04510 [Planctomycetota bacterium]
MISVRTLALVLASVLTVGSACALAQLTITERLSLTGTVEAVAGGRLTIRDDEGARHEVRVQKADEQSVPLADGRIEPGATVVRLEGLRLDTGDVVAKTLVAENPATTTIPARGDDALENKYRSLSAEPPTEPRLVRSPHFAFLTDVSDREWAVIRDKLERIIGLLERFFGRKSTGVVEGFIVRDLAAWPRGMLREPIASRRWPSR